MSRAVTALLASALAAGTLVATASASPGRFSVGLAPEADAAEVGAAVESATGARPAASLDPLRALVFETADVEGAVGVAAGLPGVAFAERVTKSRSLSFVAADDLAPRQWYLSTIRAFDFWTSPPVLPPVLVAVVDSGIDAGHPELRGRIEGLKSFVGTPAGRDTEGHGTVIGGEIAAALDAEGIAGVGLESRLLVAKVVGRNGNISVEAVAKAIRWAVDRGARVVNLSLGGNLYSELERSAVDYATRNGVVVVAAAGNGYGNRADYPARLPHVIGVGATANRQNKVAAFSNRDATHVDLAAPGRKILSTFPRALTDGSCVVPGYTPCAIAEKQRDYIAPEGTSFAAPLVAAAAAVLLASKPAFTPLHASQVTQLVEGSARDIGEPGRDRATGGGVLDVTRALWKLRSLKIPARDRYEPNDGTGERAVLINGASRKLQATVTSYEDPVDVYRVRIRRGQRLSSTLSGPALRQTGYALWRPGTPRAVGAGRRWRVAGAERSGSVKRLAFRAERGGAYFIIVRGRGGSYELALDKR